MAKLNAIVRMLPAVETLGSVTVICSDKTGTLTKNEMTLSAFITSTGRYQFDTNSSKRVPSNFVRNDAFMATRSGQDAAAAPPLPTDSTPVPNGQSPTTAFFNSAMAGGVLCSQSRLGVNGGRDGEIGNPTEIAIVRAAYFAGVEIDGMRKKSPQVAEVPFSSEYKFMATVHEPVAEIDGSGYDGEYVVHVKGAPDRMVAMCSHQAIGGQVGKDNMEPIDKDYWTRQISVLSSYGLRVLALTRGSVPKDSVKKGDQLNAEFVKSKGEWLTIVGLCAIMDPPRPECVDAIKTAHKAGIRVVMITGDHKDTAIAIGEMLGLVDEKFSEAKTGPELDSMDEMEMRHAVMNYNVFARASPQNKIQIVEALQAEQQVCSMTGDGVNDAPALKKADMGVAMGKEGTDVAREASEMILADDNFATIVAAVREGRVVWDNLRKILFVNTPINNAQGLSVLFGMIFGMKETLLTPIQVLYCNLICAVTLGFVLAVEPAEDGIMEMKPRVPGKRLIGRYLLLRIIIASATLIGMTVGASYLVRGEDYDLEAIRSQASNTLTFSAISVCLSARFSYLSSLHPRLFQGNPFCWYSLAPLITMQLIITYTPGLNSVLFGMGPMDGFQWGIVGVCMVITFLIMETEKCIRSSLKKNGVDTDDINDH
jgi:magnesium-transporting ATPase (P-type)